MVSPLTVELLLKRCGEIVLPVFNILQALSENAAELLQP